MERLLLLCILLPCAYALSADTKWQIWKRKFSKSYGSLHEEISAKLTWTKNLRLVEQHNNRPWVQFRMALNKFSDQLPENRKKFSASFYGDNSVLDVRSPWEAPAEFDWRKKGVVPPVQDEGEMGSDVAIVAASAVASFTAITKGHLYNLSVAEVAQCCSTHALGPVFYCIHHMRGLCEAGQFKAGPCRNPPCTQVGKVKGGQVVKVGDETALQTAVLKTPVLVAIDASHPSFQMYESGIYSDPACNSTILDHAMLLVGYGVDNTGSEFWIIQNTWGVDWGMKGYVLLARNKDNQCGVASAARFPI